MTPDLDALERAARAATPGPWRHQGEDGLYLPAEPWSVEHEDSASFCYVPVLAGQDLVALIASEDGTDRVGLDAEFIAAASPASILSLIARLRTAEAALAGAREVIASGEMATNHAFAEGACSVAGQDKAVALHEKHVTDWKHRARAWLSQNPQNPQETK